MGSRWCPVQPECSVILPTARREAIQARSSNPRELRGNGSQALQGRTAHDAEDSQAIVRHHFDPFAEPSRFRTGGTGATIGIPNPGLTQLDPDARPGQDAASCKADA